MLPNYQTVKCPQPDCGADVGEPCRKPHGRNGWLEVSRGHESRHLMAKAPRQIKVACPKCLSKSGDLCQHLGRKTVSWNNSFHDERDHRLYASNNELVSGLVYEDGSPVKQPWIVRDRTLKKDKLRVLKVEKVGVWASYIYVATWDSFTWYCANEANPSKQLARSRANAVDLLADLGARLTQTPRTVWFTKPGRAPEVFTL